MTIHDALAPAAKRLAASQRQLDEGWAEAEALLAHVLKRDRIWLVAHGREQIREGQRQKFENLVARRLKHEPLAYLLGQVEFSGRIFLTDKRALIPRVETEELAARALDLVRRGPEDGLVWDVGAGSGAIAVTVAAECPATRVIASDIDGKALGLAKQNAKRLLPSQKNLTLVKADLLAKKIQTLIAHSAAGRLLVLANLPYLPASDKKKLAPDVVKYEPSRALFVAGDGTALIRKLLDQLSNFLKIVGTSLRLTVLAEFDPPQAAGLKRLAQKKFPRASVAILKDSCGRDRFLEIRT